LGRLGVYGPILGRLSLRVFSIGKYAFQKKKTHQDCSSHVGDGEFVAPLNEKPPMLPRQPAHHNKRLSQAAAGEGQALAREMRSIKKTGYFTTRSEWAFSCAAICQPSCAGLLARRGADPIWNRGPAPASP